MLLEKFRQQKTKTSTEHWAQYKTLLRRAANPKGGDVDELATLMAALDLNEGDVESHLAAVGRLCAIEHGDPRPCHVQQSRDHAATLTKEIEKLEGELEPLKKNIVAKYELRAAEERTLSIMSSKLSDLRHVAGAFPDLFADDLQRFRSMCN